MPSIRSLAVVLTFASLASACGPEGECPATGATLSLDVPEVQPEWGPGCIDSASWTTDIDPANATWTVELARDRSGTDLTVARTEDGVAAVWGNELILIDGEGTLLTRGSLGVFVDWTTFVVTDGGQMVVSDQAGALASYRVLSAGGSEVWLRLLDIDAPIFGRPALSLADDGSLWIAIAEFTPDFEDFQLTIQQWAVTGGMQSEVVIPGLDSQAFARDGAGRFLVIGNELELFAADGTAIASVDLGPTAYAAQVVGLDEGFLVGGRLADLAAVTQIDGRGEVVWNRTLPSSYVDDYHGSYVSSLARLPEGGVVAVGGEETITSTHPDTPITYASQPFVVALDDEGEPTWGERLAVGGFAASVTIGSQGEVYVGGVARSDPNEYGEADDVAWLRRYDPN